MVRSVGLNSVSTELVSPVTRLVLLEGCDEYWYGCCSSARYLSYNVYVGIEFKFKAWCPVSTISAGSIIYSS